MAIWTQFDISWSEENFHLWFYHWNHFCNSSCLRTVFSGLFLCFHIWLFVTSFQMFEIKKIVRLNWFNKIKSYWCSNYAEVFGHSLVKNLVAARTHSRHLKWLYTCHILSRFLLLFCKSDHISINNCTYLIHISITSTCYNQICLFKGLCIIYNRYNILVV